MKGRGRPCDANVNDDAGHDDKHDYVAEPAEEEAEPGCHPPEDELVLYETSAADTGGAPLACTQGQ